MTRPFLLLALFSPLLRAADQSWSVNEHHGTATKYGDMLLTPAQLSRYSEDLVPANSTSPPIRGGAVVVENSFNRWPLNTVPFVISPQYGAKNQKFLRDALKSLEAVSCFKFVDRKTQSDYIFIAPLDGCYSFVGRTGGRQLVSLSPDCLADYIVWHEILHVLGFEHEHQRPDRDSFIRVEYKNVLPGQMINFEKLKADAVEINEAYDFRSIMHYDGNAFGKHCPSLDSFKGTFKGGIKLIDNLSFSETDLKKLRDLGKCENMTPQKDSAVCADFSPICDKVASRGYCKHEKYFALLKNDCRKSCNWCDGGAFDSPNVNNSLLKAKTCTDTVPNCAFLARNGFCSNNFYRELRWQCAQTCRLCS